MVRRIICARASIPSADLDPDRRYIMHFPQEDLVMSIGSGYGGNALLGKKCFSLRIASYQGFREGWLAEHMIIMGIEDNEGKGQHYFLGSFPSACGKTNLAMIDPILEGYKVTTLGDDIAWINVGPDGRLYAINPETRLLRRGAGNIGQNKSQYDEDFTGGQILSRPFLPIPVLIWTRTPLGGKGSPKKPPKNMLDWQGNKYDPAQRQSRGPSQLPVSPSPPITAPPFQTSSTTHRAYPFPQSFSEEGGSTPFLSSVKALTGNTASSRHHHWAPKRRQPRQGRSAWSGATLWRCFLSADTTWPTISVTG